MKSNIQNLKKFSASLLMLGGFLYIFIQTIHPLDELASVGTQRWFLVAVLTSLMSLSNFIGLVGAYLSQKEKAGVLSFIGMFLFGIFWLISMTFSFNEAFIWPLLKATNPDFVSGMTGLFGTSTSTVDLGIFPALAAISGILYILGGALYGFASFKNKILSRYASLLLTIAAFVTVLASVVPHPFDRVLAVPMGVALFWLGISVWKTEL